MGRVHRTANLELAGSWQRFPRGRRDPCQLAQGHTPVSQALGRGGTMPGLSYEKDRCHRESTAHPWKKNGGVWGRETNAGGV